VQCHGLFQETPRRSAIALGSEEEVDRVAIAINAYTLSLKSVVRLPSARLALASK
jgi:hypothetical protein